MSAVTKPWRQFICRACGLIYDEEKGDADSGIAPGTRFEDIPEDWECPLCGVVKADFEPYVVVMMPAPSASAAPLAARGRGVANRGVAIRGVVIVGAGIAGWSAAEAIRRLDRDVPITMVTSCMGDRYHKPELSIALSRGMVPASLVRETATDAARRLGVRLLTETFVVGLTPATHQLRTTRGTLHYTHLVMAMGARPAMPAALPPALCWRVNDLAGWSRLQARIGDGRRRIAIVGAGMIGCELAEDFARAGHDVTLIDVQPLPLGNMLPEAAALRLRAGLAQTGVKFAGTRVVAGLTQSADGGKRMTLDDGATIDADEVVVAIGLVTDSRVARGAGLAFDKGIVVDAQTLETSARDVYALGDCISLNGAPCRFIEPIAQQASAIAHAVTGRGDARYEHRQPVVRLKTRSVPIVVHGTPMRDGEWRVLDDTADFLHMQQWRDGVAIATLQAGTARQAIAA